jgi:hypothetical protein
VQAGRLFVQQQHMPVDAEDGWPGDREEPPTVAWDMLVRSSVSVMRTWGRSPQLPWPRPAQGRPASIW